MTDSQLVKTVEQSASQSLTWIQKHERVLLVGLVLGASAWVSNHWINASADAARGKVTVAIAQLKEQQSKDAALQTQTQQSMQQYQALVVSMQAQNAQLAAAISNRTIVLQQQQQQDRTMPLPDVATRWAQMADLQSGDLTAAPDGIKVSPAAARSTVAQLEQVPVLEANFRDAKAETKNVQAGLDKANVVIGDQGKQIDGLKVEIKDEGKACDAKLSEVKTADRKSKRNWFLRGAAVGAVAAGYVLIHFL